MIKLNVPYFSQLDNDSNYFGNGARQCNVTASAMAANFILANHGMESLQQRAVRLGLNEPESAFGQIVNRYGDTINHGAITQALVDLKLESHFSTTLDVADAIASLDKKIPMPIGVYYKSSGHIICLVGYDKDFFWAHDPYGRRAGEADYYQEIGGGSGEYEKYSFDLMKRIWAVGGDGWGRVFTKINGKATGL